MKNIVFFFLFPVLVNAQDIVSDSSWLFNLNGKFYDAQRIVYSDGTYLEKSIALGDTASVISLYANRITNEAQSYANAVKVAIKAQASTAQLLKLDTLINSTLGSSPLSAVMSSYERDFLEGTWEIQYNGSTIPVTFPRLSSNQRIRLLPAGSTARTFLIFGDMLRLVNYPIQGNNTLFKIRAGRWENIARTIVLRKTSSR